MITQNATSLIGAIDDKCTGGTRQTMSSATDCEHSYGWLHRKSTDIDFLYRTCGSLCLTQILYASLDYVLTFVENNWPAVEN